MKLFAAFAPLLLSASLLSGAAPAQAKPQHPDLAQAFSKYAKTYCAATNQVTGSKRQFALTKEYLKKYDPYTLLVVSEAMREPQEEWQHLFISQVLETCPDRNK